MSTSVAASLAVLKVNWDRMGRDYLSNFVPFVADTAHAIGADVVSLPEIQVAITNRFGLRLPLNPLRQILTRCSKEGYFRKESGVLYTDHKKCAELRLQDSIDAAEASTNRVIASFSEFLDRQDGKIPEGHTAETLLLSFITERGLAVLHSIREKVLGLPNQLDPGLDYLAGRFIHGLAEGNDPLLEDVVTIAKGQILTDALYLPDPGNVGMRFRQTRVYLVPIRSLGSLFFSCRKSAFNAGFLAVAAVYSC